MFKHHADAVYGTLARPFTNTILYTPHVKLVGSWKEIEDNVPLINNRLYLIISNLLQSCSLIQYDNLITNVVNANKFWSFG